MAEPGVPHLLQALGWTLAHFLWQGALIAILAAIVMRRCQTAAARYIAGVAGLALMLAAPAATFLFAYDIFGPADLTLTFSHGPSSLMAAMPSHLLAARPDILPWLAKVWFCGVLCFGMRLAGGLLILEHRRRRRSVDAGAEVLALCRNLQRRLGLTRTIRYLECDWLQAPAVIGWLRPAVLLPVTALTGFSPEQFAAVITHELAHIRRHDALVNLFQILAETLLFYHPAVWWLNGRIRASREICCDEVAVSLCGDRIAYARALTLMEEWKHAPRLVLAANHGFLSERIFCVLGRQAAPRLPGVTVLLMLAALTLGITLMRMPAPVFQARPTQPVIAAQARVTAPARIAHAVPARKRVGAHKVRVAVEPAVENMALVRMVQASPPPMPVPADIAPVQLIALSDPGDPPAPAADPVVCRMPQFLPGSRIAGPRTCLPQSQWAELRSRNQDIAPDGRQVVATLAFDNGSIPDVRLWQGAKLH